MVIENNQNTKSIPINVIKYGECFMYNNCLYVKINQGCIDVKPEFSNVIVNLENNRLNTVSDNVMVTPVNAKIVVEQGECN